MTILCLANWSDLLQCQILCQLRPHDESPAAGVDNKLRFPRASIGPLEIQLDNGSVRIRAKRHCCESRPACLRVRLYSLHIKREDHGDGIGKHTEAHWTHSETSFF